MPARTPESIFAEWLARQGTPDEAPFENRLRDHPARLPDLRSMQQELDKVLRPPRRVGARGPHLQ